MCPQFTPRVSDSLALPNVNRSMKTGTSTEQRRRFAVSVDIQPSTATAASTKSLHASYQREAHLPLARNGFRSVLRDEKCFNSGWRSQEMKAVGLGMIAERMLTTRFVAGRRLVLLEDCRGKNAEQMKN